MRGDLEKVENGLTAAAVKQLEARLRPLVVKRSPVNIASRPKAIAVAPKVLVDISYPNKSADHLRHPRFVRVRDDLKPETGQ